MVVVGTAQIGVVEERGRTAATASQRNHVLDLAEDATLLKVLPAARLEKTLYFAASPIRAGEIKGLY
jgi:hypothetical protein